MTKTARRTMKGKSSVSGAICRHQGPVVLFFFTFGLCRDTRVCATGSPYPVYFDTHVEKDRIPIEGYPQSEIFWDEVKREHYIFDLDFLGLSNQEYSWKENKCKNNLLEKYGTGNYERHHRQSPVQVQRHGDSSDYCASMDLFDIIRKGDCRRRERNVNFDVTPYGLKADFRGCNEQPHLEFYDHSWVLDYMFIKVPGEHERHRSYSPAETFGGEIHLVHRGVEDPSQIGIIAIWLKTDNNSLNHNNNELQKYINKWKFVQKNQYDACGVAYDTEKCQLVNQEDIPSTECDRSCCTRNLRTTGWDPKFPIEPKTHLDELQTLQQQNQELTEIVNEMEDEMNAMKKELETLLKENSSGDKIHRSLFSGDCNTSEFCPNDLWKKTGGTVFAYQGSLTHPPCTENVEWRIMREPLVISKQQMLDLEYLVAKHIDPQSCTLATVGRRRPDSCLVDVNRMVQYLSVDHNLQDCVNLGAYYFDERDGPISEPRPPEQDADHGDY